LKFVGNYVTMTTVNERQPGLHKNVLIWRH